MSALDICNEALAKLGEAPISGITPDGSLAQRMCYCHYHPVRRSVLCILKPEFARRTATIDTFGTADGETKLPHTLPELCLRVLKAGDKPWTLNHRQIFSAEQELQIEYVADVEDTDKFNELFREAFATMLAAKMCVPLINSLHVKQELMGDYAKLTGIKLETI